MLYCTTRVGATSLLLNARNCFRGRYAIMQRKLLFLNVQTGNMSWLCPTTKVLLTQDKAENDFQFQ